MSMKNPLTPAGIERATFRIVAQHLNHCATAVPELTMCVCYFVSAMAAPFMKLEVTLESTINPHILVKISLA